MPESAGGGYRRLAYIHLPRTGGTAVERHLQAIVGEREVLRIALPPDFLEQLSGLSSARVVIGHFFYPLVRLIPGATVATVVREPVERALSVWEFLNWQRSHSHHRLLAERGIDDMSQFLDDPLMWLHVSDVQTRILGVDQDVGALVEALRSGDIDLEEARRRAGEPVAARVDDAMLKRAKRRLREMPLVGVTDRLPDFVRRLETVLGLPAGPALALSNASPAEMLRRRPQAYTDDVRRALADMNTYDAELYTYARELWLERAL
jgi:hypothetical protein